MVVANAMVGSKSWIGGTLIRSVTRRFASIKYLDYPLSSIQVEIMYTTTLEISP